MAGSAESGAFALDGPDPEGIDFEGVTIEMRGQVESLNAMAAATLLLFAARGGGAGQ